MKKIRVIPILVVLCSILLAAAIYGFVADLIKNQTVQLDVYLGDYKNIAVEVDVEELTDDMVEEAVNELLVNAYTEEAVTDGAKSGDIAIISYTGTFQGETEPTFSGEEERFILDYDLNAFAVEGLNDHLLGAKPEDVIKVTLTVQEDYHAEAYVGKRVDFTVTVHSITRVTVPELTDDFAKTQGYESAAAMEQWVHSRVSENIHIANNMMIRNAVWEKVKSNAKILDPRTEEVTKAKEEYLSQMEEFSSAQGYDLLGFATLFYGFDGTTTEELEEWVTNEVWAKIKDKMVTDAICQKEGIALSDREYQQYVADYIKQNQDAGFSDYTKQDLIEDLGVVNEEGLKSYLLWMEITDLLIENATITTY